MQTVKKKIEELQRNPRNVRKHSEKQISEYVRSIKMFGQIRPIVCDENGLILAGNGLYDALASMGAEECDCYVVKGLTETQKDKLMLADNKVYDLGVTDMDAIESLVKGLGDDLDVPGYDDEVLKLITATVTEATRSVMEYGKVPQEQDAEPRVQKTAGDFGVTAKQVAEQDAPAPYSGDERKSMVCPHCGETIWL